MFKLKLRRSVRINTLDQDNSYTLIKQLGEYVKLRCQFRYSQFKNIIKDIPAAKAALVSILCQKSCSQNRAKED